MGVDQTTLQRFVAILNCDVMVTPFTYLGMSVGGALREERFGVVWLKDWRVDWAGGKVGFCQWLGEFVWLS